MTFVLGGLAVLLFLVMVVTAFVRMDAATMARALRLGGPVVLACLGGVALMLGRASIGGMMLAGAASWYGYTRRGGLTQTKPTAGKRSTVRTAALEMELDHDSGGLEGMVLAGRHEQKMLGDLGLDELLEVFADLRGDGESRQLLETYLDGRFPVWRKDADADRGDRERVAPGSGAMTKQEAYKVPWS